MSALRVAGRYRTRFILKFEGCYHGHADTSSQKAGLGRRHRVPDLGVPSHRGADPLVPFNGLDAGCRQLERTRVRSRR
jgi:glutamate-1-semialdehyde aminotransferase